MVEKRGSTTISRLCVFAFASVLFCYLICMQKWMKRTSVLSCKHWAKTTLTKTMMILYLKGKIHCYYSTWCMCGVNGWVGRCNYDRNSKRWRPSNSTHTRFVFVISSSIYILASHNAHAIFQYRDLFCSWPTYILRLTNLNRTDTFFIKLYWNDRDRGGEIEGQRDYLNV